MDFDKDNCPAKPTEGVFINGLILEGASFDRKKKILIDAMKVNYFINPGITLHAYAYYPLPASKALVRRQRQERQILDLPMPSVQDLPASRHPVDHRPIDQLRPRRGHPLELTPIVLDPPGDCPLMPAKRLMMDVIAYILKVKLICHSSACSSTPR